MSIKDMIEKHRNYEGWKAAGLTDKEMAILVIPVKEVLNLEDGTALWLSGIDKYANYISEDKRNKRVEKASWQKDGIDKEEKN